MSLLEELYYEKISGVEHEVPPDSKLGKLISTVNKNDIHIRTMLTYEQTASSRNI